MLKTVFCLTMTLFVLCLINVSSEASDVNELLPVISKQILTVRSGIFKFSGISNSDASIFR